MISPNGLLNEQVSFVDGLNQTVPSSSTPDYVSLRNADRLTILIKVANGVTVTGSAIALKQATNVAAGNEKALAFDKVYANTDTGAAQPLAETAVSSNTFTTDNTNSKNLMYVIEIKASDLDINNGFDCVRLATGNSTNARVDATYILWPLRYKKPIPLSPIID